MRYGGMLLILIASSAHGLGCDDGRARAFLGALAAPDKWQVLEERDDPFAQELGELGTDSVQRCSASSVQVEGEGAYAYLEVSTEYCNAVSLTQPSQLALAAGVQLEIEVAHSVVTALKSAAQATLVLRVDGEELWRKQVPLPGASGVHRKVLTVQRSIAKGAEVVFHLRNHGNNAWRLMQLDVRG